MKTVDFHLSEVINKKPLDTKKIMTFLELGANPNLCDKNGVPLLFVLFHAKKKEEMFTLIEKYKVNVSTINPATQLTVIATLYSNKNAIAESYHLEDVSRLLAAGADLNTHLANGRPLLYRMLTAPFFSFKQIKWVIDKLRTCKPDVHIRDKTTGKTILEMLLDNSDVSLEICMELVKLGANPTFRNAKGESLLSMLVDKNEKEEWITELNGYIDAWESASTPDLETADVPEISPRELTFIEKGRALFDQLKNPNMPKEMARNCAISWPHQGHTYTSKNKEMVIAYIQSLPPQEKMAALTLALKKGSPYYSNSGAAWASATVNQTPLHAFFGKTRGGHLTTYRAGSFKQLFAMHDELWLAEAYAREKRGEPPVEPAFPIINRKALIEYIKRLSPDHQKIMLDKASTANRGLNNISRSFLIQRGYNQGITYSSDYKLLNQIHGTSYPLANLESRSKESVINEINTLPREEKQRALTDSLTPGNSLYGFFDVQRRLFPTSESRGSFKKLKTMQLEMQLSSYSESSKALPILQP